MEIILKKPPSHQTTGFCPSRLLKIAVLVVGTGWPAVQSQEVSEYARLQAEQRRQEVNLLTRQIEGMRQRRLAMERSNTAEIAGIKTDILRLEEACANLEESVQKEKQTQKDLAEQRAKVDEETAKNREAIAGLARSSADIARRLDQSVLSGLPYKKDERREKIAVVQEALEDADSATRARGIMDLAAFFDSEFTLASSTSFFNAPVHLKNGRKRHAYQVRLGLVQQVFVAEDHHLCGLFTPESGDTWHTDLTETEKAALIRGLAILGKRRPPELTPVPWLVSPSATTTGDSHATD